MKEIKKHLDLPISILSSLIFIAAIVVLALLPDFSRELINSMFVFITSKLGLYLITNFAGLIILQMGKGLEFSYGYEASLLAIK
jgi:choline-glycine betaine transporter